MNSNLTTLSKSSLKGSQVSLPDTSNVVEFSLFYLHCRSLEFKQAPDYGYLRRLLRDMIYKESFEY